MDEVPIAVLRNITQGRVKKPASRKPSRKAAAERAAAKAMEEASGGGGLYQPTGAAPEGPGVHETVSKDQPRGASPEGRVGPKTAAKPTGGPAPRKGMAGAMVMPGVAEFAENLRRKAAEGTLRPPGAMQEPAAQYAAVPAEGAIATVEGSVERLIGGDVCRRWTGTCGKKKNGDGAVACVTTLYCTANKTYKIHLAERTEGTVREVLVYTTSGFLSDKPSTVGDDCVKLGRYFVWGKKAEIADFMAAIDDALTGKEVQRARSAIVLSEEGDAVQRGIAILTDAAAAGKGKTVTRENTAPEEEKPAAAELTRGDAALPERSRAVAADLPLVPAPAPVTIVEAAKAAVPEAPAQAPIAPAATGPAVEILGAREPRTTAIPGSDDDDDAIDAAEPVEPRTATGQTDAAGTAAPPGGETATYWTGVPLYVSGTVRQRKKKRTAKGALASAAGVETAVRAAIVMYMDTLRAGGETLPSGDGPMPLADVGAAPPAGGAAPPAGGEAADDPGTDVPRPDERQTPGGTEVPEDRVGAIATAEAKTAEVLPGATGALRADDMLPCSFYKGHAGWTRTEGWTVSVAENGDSTMRKQGENDLEIRGCTVETWPRTQTRMYRLSNETGNGWGVGFDVDADGVAFWGKHVQAKTARRTNYSGYLCAVVTGDERDDCVIALEAGALVVRQGNGTKREFAETAYWSMQKPTDGVLVVTTRTQGTYTFTFYAFGGEAGVFHAGVFYDSMPTTARRGESVTAGRAHTDESGRAGVIAAVDTRGGALPLDTPLASATGIVIRGNDLKGTVCHVELTDKGECIVTADGREQIFENYWRGPGEEINLEDDEGVMYSVRIEPAEFGAFAAHLPQRRPPLAPMVLERETREGTPPATSGDSAVGAAAKAATDLLARDGLGSATSGDSVAVMASVATETLADAPRERSPSPGDVGDCVDEVCGTMATAEAETEAVPEGAPQKDVPPAPATARVETTTPTPLPTPTPTPTSAGPASAVPLPQVWLYSSQTGKTTGGCTIEVTAAGDCNVTMPDGGQVLEMQAKLYVPKIAVMTEPRIEWYVFGALKYHATFETEAARDAIWDEMGVKQKQKQQQQQQRTGLPSSSTDGDIVPCVINSYENMGPWRASDGCQISVTGAGRCVIQRPGKDPVELETYTPKRVGTKIHISTESKGRYEVYIADEGKRDMVWGLLERALPTGASAAAVRASASVTGPVVRTLVKKFNVSRRVLPQGQDIASGLALYVLPDGRYDLEITDTATGEVKHHEANFRRIPTLYTTKRSRKHTLHFGTYEISAFSTVIDRFIKVCEDIVKGRMRLG